MKSYAEITDLIRQLNGRAQYLRDKGQVKTPDLLERAAGVIKDAKSNPRMFTEVGEAIKQQSTMQPSNGAMSGDAVKQSSSNAHGGKS